MFNFTSIRVLLFNLDLVETRLQIRSRHLDCDFHYLAKDWV